MCVIMFVLLLETGLLNIIMCCLIKCNSDQLCNQRIYFTMYWYCMCYYHYQSKACLNFFQCAQLYVFKHHHYSQTSMQLYCTDYKPQCSLFFLSISFTKVRKKKKICRYKFGLCIDTRTYLIFFFGLIQTTWWGGEGEGKRNNGAQYS